jgi:hypothetical protein
MDAAALKETTDFLNVVFLALSIAILIATIVTWIIAIIASKDKALTFKSVWHQATSKLVLFLHQYKLLFGLTFIALLVQQIGTVVLAVAPLNQADELVRYGQNTAIDLARAVLSLIATCGKLLCQFYILKCSFANDTVSDASYKIGKKQFGYLLIAVFLANLINTTGLILLIVPGLILANILWLAGPVSIGEYRAASAISRCFQIAKNRFWDIAKIVMPFVTLITLGQLIPEAMVVFNAPAVATTIVEAISTISMLLLALMIWQCQYVLYKYLIKSNYGVQYDPTAKTSEPQT